MTSQYVLDEAAGGDPQQAIERLRALDGVPLLDLPPNVTQIANSLLSQSVLPQKAELDALHIAVASLHRVKYLLTWNCTHIANARMLPRVAAALARLGYSTPYICTLEEMLDDDETSA